MQNQNIASKVPLVDNEQRDTEITALVAEIREHQRVVEEEDSRIQTLKVRLAELLEARGSNWADDEGYARLVSEGLRVSYDTNQLDDLIIKDPLRYGWLREYRRENPVSGRVQVK